MNNIKSAQEAITLENSFIKLRFGQSGLFGGMFKQLWNLQKACHFYYNIHRLPRKSGKGDPVFWRGEHGEVSVPSPRGP